MYHRVSRHSPFHTTGSIMPVSYTHLDVYKRQVRHCGNSVSLHPASCTPQLWRLPTAASAHRSRREYTLSLIHIFLHTHINADALAERFGCLYQQLLALCYHSVSYTHLRPVRQVNIPRLISSTIYLVRLFISQDVYKRQGVFNVDNVTITE